MAYTRKRYNRKPRKPIARALPAILPPMPPALAQEFKKEIALATNKIKSWTRHQLGAYQDAKQPVCIPINNGYKIGLYRLHVQSSKVCDVYGCNDELVHSFNDTVSAILYTIYTIKQRIDIAMEILTLDAEINRNYNDMLLLKHAISFANKQKDYFTVDSRQARLDIVEQRLQLARNRLMQIHDRAKRLKVWN